MVQATRGAFIIQHTIFIIHDGSSITKHSAVDETIITVKT